MVRFLCPVSSSDWSLLSLSADRVTGAVQGGEKGNGGKKKDICSSHQDTESLLLYYCLLSAAFKPNVRYCPLLFSIM